MPSLPDLSFRSHCRYLDRRIWVLRVFAPSREQSSPRIARRRGFSGLEKVIIRSPVIAASLTVALVVAFDAALAQGYQADSGLSLSQLAAMDAVQFSDLLQKTGVRQRGTRPPRKEGRGVAPTAFLGAGRQGVAIQDLLRAQPTPIGEILHAAHHSHASERAPKALLAGSPVIGRSPGPGAADRPHLAETLPKAVKTALPAGAVPSAPKVSSRGQPLLPESLAVRPDPALGRPTRDAKGLPEIQDIPGILAPVGLSDALMDPLAMKIERGAQGLHVTPRSLVFPRIGRLATILMPGNTTDLSLFVRDQGVVALEAGKGQLTALKRGVTELYVVSQGKMVIVPMTVEDGGSQWDLKIPDALVSLEGIFRKDSTSGLAASASFQIPEGSTSASSLSLRDSVVETEKSLAEQALRDREISLNRGEVTYGTLSVQVMDDRSNSKQGRLYPAMNVDVRLVGTDLKVRTDATGHVTIRDVPQGSRFQLRLDDPTAALRPSLVEVEAKQGVVRVRMIRSFVFDALLNILQSAQDMALGSYCGTVTDATESGAPVEGVRIALDTPHEGPFYFNRYGFPDRAQAATGVDGRFCFLNILSGPATLTLSEASGGQEMATVVVPVYSGRHVEEDLTVGQEQPFRTRLFAMASAHEQLSTDHPSAMRYVPVDMVDLIPLGAEAPLAQLGAGLIATEEVTPVDGKIRTLARAAEFEPALYQYKSSQAQPITPLIPRGFVEDLALYAQVSQDPEQGSVLVEFGHPKGVDTSVNMRLLDQFGRDVGDGWYFSDSPLTKAMFFNVPPGIYTVLVETKDRYWLAADSIYVYNETVSYLNLGSELRYRALRKREDNGR